jgi:hypothetical protein
MPRKGGTGGETRPTGETAVRRYTAEEHQARLSRAYEHLGRALADPQMRPETTLRLVLSGADSRVELVCQLPNPEGDGMVGQTIALSEDDDGVDELIAAASRVAEAHRARAVGASHIAWAQHLTAILPTFEPASTLDEEEG